MGADSVGILAQSIGGGGGVVLGLDNAVSATFAAGTGQPGTVTVGTNAISTQGIGAVALLAQSIGGGGGAVISSYSSSNQNYGVTLGNGGGNGGNVNVTTYNQPITTLGTNASAVIAQSVGVSAAAITARRMPQPRARWR